MLKNWLHALKTQKTRRTAMRSAPRLEILETRSLLSATLGVGCGHEGEHEEHLVDADGNEYHALPKSRTVSGTTTTGSGSGGTVEAALDLSQTFLLHSNPTANHVIYLDFDGSTTTGTSWNSSFTGGADIVTPAYDTDGVAGFSATEQQNIQYIWQRVAEDFAPFNVNVTTQEPGIEALRKSGTGDTQWGVRVVIGGDGAWYGSAGGVAYLGSFNWNSDTPTFVFENNLGNGNEKYTAEAISHEAGHTLGLNHDGTATLGYYEGHGTGTTGWAPIMGVGYYKNLVQWSRGEYTGANQTQDDLTIITTQNGFSYRADLAGDTISTSAAATVSGTAVSGSGIIERTSDLDVFSFTTGAGTVSFDVQPFSRGPNLDIEAKILNASGSVVATANPTGALNASISASVAAGQYYLQINGVGEGDPLATGYSDYGSLGQYSFTGTIVGAGSVPMITIQDATTTESGSLSFRVVLSAAATSDVTVNFATANGTAVSGSDYTANSGTLTFAPGELEKFITVSVIDDTTVESSETVLVNLSGASSNAAISDGQGQGTITDNDVAPPPPPMSLSINDVSTTEGNLSRRGAITSRNVTFTITLSQVPTSQVRVNWATANGTATSGSDYVAASGSVTFKSGQVSRTVSVTVYGDNTAEGDETFVVNLSGATGAVINDGSGTCTIINDDGTSAGQVADLVEVESDTPAPQRGYESFAVRRDLIVPQAVSIDEGAVDVTVVEQAATSTESSSPSIGAERAESAAPSDAAFAQLDRLMAALS